MKIFPKSNFFKNCSETFNKHKAVLIFLINYSCLLCLFPCCASLKIKYKHFSHLTAKIPADWENENIIILKDSIAYCFNESFGKAKSTVVRDTWYYINKRQPNDLENIWISYHTGASKPPEGFIEIYKPNGKMAKKDFRMAKEYEWIGSQGYHYGYKSKKVTIAGYCTGMVIHKYEKVEMIRPEQWHMASLRGSYNTLEKTITFTTPTDADIKYGFENKEEIPADTFTVLSSPLKTFLVKTSLVDKFDPKVTLKYPENWYAALHFSAPLKSRNSKSWKELGDYYLDEIQESLESSPEIKKLAESIKSTATRAVITEAFDLLQERVRYHADEVGKYGWVPRAASKIFVQGYGDCKEKSTLLKMILAEKGITVNFASIMAHEGRFQHHENYPTLGGSNHIILWHENEDGFINYYDPTADFSNAEKSCMWLTGQKVLLFEKGKSRNSILNLNDDYTTTVLTKSAISQDGDTGNWVMKGEITLLGRAAWFYKRASFYNKGEAFRPMVKKMLKSKFKLVPLEFKVTRNTLDTFQIAYKSDIGEKFLNIDKGGILIDTPGIYKRGNAPPKNFTGPRYFRGLRQTDTWVLPEKYREIERQIIKSAYGKGSWEFKRNELKRTYIIQETRVQASEKSEAVKYGDLRNKFSKTTIWKNL